MEANREKQQATSIRDRRTWLRLGGWDEDQVMQSVERETQGQELKDKLYDGAFIHFPDQIAMWKVGAEWSGKQRIGRK